MTPPDAVTDDDARRLVLALCPLAGDRDAVTSTLLDLIEGSDPRRLLTLTMTALAVVFTECLTEPAPTTAGRTTP